MCDICKSPSLEMFYYLGFPNAEAAAIALDAVAKFLETAGDKVIVLYIVTAGILLTC